MTLDEIIERLASIKELLRIVRPKDPTDQLAAYQGIKDLIQDLQDTQVNEIALAQMQHKLSEGLRNLAKRLESDEVIPARAWLEVGEIAGPGGSYAVCLSAVLLTPLPVPEPESPR